MARVRPAALQDAPAYAGKGVISRPSQEASGDAVLHAFLSESLLAACAGVEEGELHIVARLVLAVDAGQASASLIGDCMPALTSLVMNDSLLGSVRELGTSLRMLTLLSLARCGLADLDGALSALPSLLTLLVPFNHITDVSALAGHECLETLDLEGNRIVDESALSSVGTMGRLTSLRLWDNPVVFALGRGYRAVVATLAPGITMLDDETVTEAEHEGEEGKEGETEEGGGFRAGSAVGDPTGVVRGEEGSPASGGSVPRFLPPSRPATAPLEAGGRPMTASSFGSTLTHGDDATLLAGGMAAARRKRRERQGSAPGESSGGGGVDVSDGASSLNSSAASLGGLGAAAPAPALWIGGGRRSGSRPSTAASFSAASASWAPAARGGSAGRLDVGSSRGAGPIAPRRPASSASTSGLSFRGRMPSIGGDEEEEEEVDDARSAGSMHSAGSLGVGGIVRPGGAPRAPPVSLLVLLDRARAEEGREVARTADELREWRRALKSAGGAREAALRAGPDREGEEGGGRARRVSTLSFVRPSSPREPPPPQVEEGAAAPPNVVATVAAGGPPQGDWARTEQAQLLALLRLKPKHTTVLHSRDAFRRFFAGISRPALTELLTLAATGGPVQEGETPAGLSDRIARRLELMDGAFAQE